MKNNLNVNIDKNFNWEIIQKELRNQFGNEIYESWLKKIVFEEKFTNHILVSVSTRFIRDWIVSRYLDQILGIIKKFNKEIIRVEFKIENKVDFNKNDNQINANTKISFIKDSFLQYNRIDQNKSFENFVIGESNKLAFEAAKKVSEKIAHYNPFYLYAGVGMGKTHLLNAIGLKLKKDKKFTFISAERFMYQFVKSIKSNEMVKFKENFRNSDVLIIDDIQFMNGKEAMQEEFFHTFNALIDKDSQVILSADRPPNKLVKIQERIKSRFSGGLVVDIQSPEHELRLKILKTKVDDLNILYNEKLKLSSDILNFISSEIRNSVRELVGALNRVASFARIYDRVPNINEVKIILKDLLNINETKITIDNIQTLVCKYFKISKNEMLSSRRSRYLVRPRQVAIYLSKILTTKSLPEIGREFSNRDHTKLIQSFKTIESLKLENTEISKGLNKIKNQILYNNENEI